MSDGWMDGWDGISPDRSISRSPSGDKNTLYLLNCIWQFANHGHLCCELREFIFYKNNNIWDLNLTQSLDYQLQASDIFLQSIWCRDILENVDWFSDTLNTWLNTYILPETPFPKRGHMSIIPNAPFSQFHQHLIQLILSPHWWK